MRLTSLMVLSSEAIAARFPLGLMSMQRSDELSRAMWSMKDPSSREKRSTEQSSVAQIKYLPLGSTARALHNSESLGSMDCTSLSSLVAMSNWNSLAAPLSPTAMILPCSGNVLRVVNPYPKTVCLMTRDMLDEFQKIEMNSPLCEKPKLQSYFLTGDVALED